MLVRAWGFLSAALWDLRVPGWNRDRLRVGEVMRDLETWLRSGQYLPPAMRDFHDQKNIFKRIQEMSDRYKWLPGEKPDFRVSMCYTIDIFLWFMAMHGYTLQKTRQSVDGVRCLDATVKEYVDRQQEAMWEHIRARSGGGSDAK
jgi:hypothetical protein